MSLCNSARPVIGRSCAWDCQWGIGHAVAAEMKMCRHPRRRVYKTSINTRRTVRDSEPQIRETMWAQPTNRMYGKYSIRQSTSIGFTSSESSGPSTGPVAFLPCDDRGLCERGLLFLAFSVSSIKSCLCSRWVRSVMSVSRCRRDTPGTPLYHRCQFFLPSLRLPISSVPSGVVPSPVVG
jgi:hypothetical protein